jgi:hypothetical protein
MVGKADASTAIDWTRAVLLSMLPVQSGLGGVRGLDVWLLDRSGGLCVHKTVVRECVMEEMTEPAAAVQSVEFGAAFELVVVFGRSRRTIQVRGLNEGQIVTPASAGLFRHAVEKHKTLSHQGERLQKTWEETFTLNALVGFDASFPEQYAFWLLNIQMKKAALVLVYLNKRKKR